MQYVRQHLVVGIGMDGRHQPVLDADAVVQDLGQRRQAIGGAGCIGNDVITALERIVVDAVHDGIVHVLARG